MKLYHGTTERVARLALESGLKPRSVTKTSNWNHTVDSNKHCVYLTNAYPLYFAMNAIKDDDEPAIVEIDTDRLDESWLMPDEDILEFIGRGGDGLPKGWDMKRRTRYYRKRLPDYQHLWEKSLNTLGTCAYMGSIPADAVTRIAVIEREKNRGLCWSAMDAQIIAANYKLVGDRYKAMVRWIFDNEYEPTEEDRMRERLGIPSNATLLQQQGRDGIDVINHLVDA